MNRLSETERRDELSHLNFQTLEAVSKTQSLQIQSRKSFDLWKQSWGVDDGAQFCAGDIPTLFMFRATREPSNVGGSHLAVFQEFHNYQEMFRDRSFVFLSLLFPQRVQRGGGKLLASDSILTLGGATSHILYRLCSTAEGRNLPSLSQFSWEKLFRKR